MNQIKLLRRKDLAEFFGVTTRSLDRYRREPKFPAPIMLCGTPRWTIESIEKFLAQASAESEKSE